MRRSIDSDVARVPLPPAERPDPSDPPIADYGCIGDSHGVALLGRDGSIDWCCLPHVDSPAFFLRLLDRERGGFFRVAPEAEILTIERRYVANTNVIQTTFHTAAGAVRLLDAFDVGEESDHGIGDPPGRAHRILRLVECLWGECDVDLTCRVTPDFARQVPRVERSGSRSVTWRWNGGSVSLGVSLPIALAGEVVRGRYRLHQGERLACVLADGPHATATVAGVSRRVQATEDKWRAWASRCAYDGRYREPVLRSALALKLLTHEPTGAVVAAPKTSLPETIGGERNWDYRFCWLRDATFTLHALELLGYRDEAGAFMRWIQRVCVACGVDLQIMYGVDGQRDLTEVTLDHLRGYRQSRPVRIGNAAHRQRQLDVFGEVLDSAYLFFHRRGGADGEGQALDGKMWALLRSLVDYVLAHWQEPDSGIWEIRDEPRHYVHSKLLCWVALDRGIRLAEAYGLAADLRAWRRERRRVRQRILALGYSKRVGAFTQAFGSDVLDASVLVMPLVGFIDARDPRMERTIAAVYDGLTQRGRLLDG